MTRRSTPTVRPGRIARASAAAAVVALLLAASPARAEGDPVVLASFAGKLPGDLAALPERLTAVMADVLTNAGSEVTRAPLGDLLAVAGCAAASDDCLQQARALLEVGRVVAGDVEAAGAGRVRIRLRLFAARKKPRHRAILLEGGSASALEADFRARAAAFWRDPDATRSSKRPGRDPSPPRAPSASEVLAPADPPAARADLTVAPADAAPADAGEGGFSARRVSPVAWGLAGGGAGLAAIGGMLLVAAADKQGQIDDAPTDTPADLDALVDLEESGRTYARWGSVLLVVGAVSAATGVGLVVMQGREVERDDRALTLSPTLLPGGAGAVLTWRAGPGGP